MPGEEEHGEGCDCGECELTGYLRRLTSFESFCLLWYQENVSQFTIEASILGEFIRELGLKGIERRLFLKAMDMIYRSNILVAQEQQRAEMERTRDGKR